MAGIRLAAPVSHASSQSGSRDHKGGKVKSIVHVTLIVVDYMLQLCVHEVREHGDVRLLAPVLERYWVEASPAVVESLLREAEEERRAADERRNKVLAGLGLDL